MPRILVIAPSWVGDAVLAQPLLRRLQERTPGVVIDVFAPPWVAAVFKHMPQVAEVIENPFKHGELKVRQRWRLSRSLSAKRYDQAIVLPNSFKSALFPLFAGIRLRTGYVGELRHGLLNDARALDRAALPLMAERFAYLAQENRVALRRPVPNPRLEVNESQREATLAKFALGQKAPIGIVCPGAEYGPAKRWPAQYFAQCARGLTQKGFALWAIGSSKDHTVGAQIEALSGGACRNLCGETNLSEAIHLIASAAFVLSNDSGLMHVAAALDKPLLALFGSSSPEFTPPLSDKAKVLSLSLECSPCFRRVCPLGHFNCMMQLKPEVVLGELGKLLSRSPLHAA